MVSFRNNVSQEYFKSLSSLEEKKERLYVAGYSPEWRLDPVICKNLSDRDMNEVKTNMDLSKLVMLTDVA